MGVRAVWNFFYIFFKMIHGVFPSSALLHVFWMRFCSNMVVISYLGGFGTCLLNNQIHFHDSIPKYNFFKNIIQSFSLRKWIFLTFLAFKKIYIYSAKVAKVLWFHVLQARVDYLIVHRWWGLQVAISIGVSTMKQMSMAFPWWIFPSAEVAKVLQFFKVFPFTFWNCKVSFLLEESRFNV
jgi:hypothetical protein